MPASGKILCINPYMLRFLTQHSLIDPSRADQNAVRPAFQNLGNGGVPGFTAPGPDGNGEADEV